MIYGAYDDIIRGVMADNSSVQDVAGGNKLKDALDEIRQWEEFGGTLTPQEKFDLIQNMLKTHPGNKTLHAVPQNRTLPSE